MSSREIMDAQGFSEAINSVNCDNFRDPVVNVLLINLKSVQMLVMKNMARLFMKREQQK